MHFNTLEKRLTNKFTSDNLAYQMQAETLEELEEIWRQNRAVGRQRSISDAESVQRLRLKNLADRILSMERLQDSELDGEQIIESVLSAESTVPCSPSRSRRCSISEEPLPLSALTAQLPPRSPASFRRASQVTNSRHTSRGSSPVRSLRQFDRPPAETGKGHLALEYSDHGTGDFRTPSFSINTANASSISPLRFRKHRVIAGKPPLPNYLPGIRCTESDATTLVVTMSDIYAGIEVDLFYTCLHDYNAIVR